MKDYIKRLRKSATARNGAWIILERVFSVGLTTIVTILAARYLGTESYGILSYGLSLVAIFVAIMKLGIDSIIVNELIHNKDRQGEVLGTSIVLRFISSILSLLSMAILLLVLNNKEPLVIGVALIQAVQLIFQALYVFDYWFQSKLQSKFVSIAKISAVVLTSAYSMYLLFTGKSVIWFAASTVITSLVISLILILFYFKQDGQRLTFSLKEAKRLLLISHHFILSNIITLIYIQIDKVMIGNILGNQQLGIYAAAMMVCTAWMFVPEAITTSMRPTIVHSKKDKDGRYLEKLKRLYFMIFWLSVGISAIITTSSPFLIPLLFGPEFKDAVTIVQVAIWFAPLAALGVARGIWIVSEKKYKYSKYYLSIGLVTNVGLNILLIPKMGILGAAIATVCTEIITCFIAPLFYKATREHPRIVLNALFHINKKVN